MRSTRISAEELERRRREQFVSRVNAGYTALRAEPEAWAAHLAERRAWDATLGDGLRPGCFGSA